MATLAKASRHLPQQRRHDHGSVGHAISAPVFPILILAPLLRPRVLWLHADMQRAGEQIKDIFSHDYMSMSQNPHYSSTELTETAILVPPNQSHEIRARP